MSPIFHRCTLRSLVGLIVALDCFVLAACQPKFINQADKLPVVAIPLPPGNQYASPTALENNQVALVIAHSDELHSSTLEVVDTVTGEWRRVPSPQRSDACRAAWSGGPMARLPNGELGFRYTCIDQSSGEKESLYSWNPTTDALRRRLDYPATIAASVFAMTPDMQSMIQESAVGAGMKNRLYLIAPDAEPERLLPDFQRARSPTWLSNGSQIAFLATAKYPSGSVEDFEKWNEIEDLLRYPWDLYLADPNGSDARIILTNITDVGRVKASPQQDVLALNGTVKKTPGIWLLNPSTQRLVRIWPGSDSYDWTPDGSRIVALEEKKSASNGLSYRLVTIDVTQAVQEVLTQ